MPHLALYQPDIPQNLGSILRLCACLDVVCHVIEPCGFVLDDKKINRVAMDYIEQVNWQRHTSWEAFLEYVNSQQSARLILLSTKATDSYYDFAFAPQDILLLGRESAGVPETVASQVDHIIKIPMHGKARSLNVAITAGMVLGEALRQMQIK